MTDEELYYQLGGKKRDSVKAFDEIYRRYSSKVYSYCRKVLNNSEVANDVFQDTFSRFYESAKVDKKMTNVSGYLIRIARNLCLNEKARKYNDKVSLEDITLPSIDKAYGSKQLSELLETAIEDLPEQYREALVLKEFMDMSYKEIAESLDLTLPIVRIRIYRAKNKLRELLSPYMEEFEKINRL